MTQPTIRIRLNGEWRDLSVAPNDLLLNTLREQEQLTGTKYGCGIGECGACTVHVDGQPVLACLTLTVAVSGCEVRTIEGLADGGRLDPVQKAFLDTAAVQCGFCTSGMIMMGRALLDDNPKPTESEIREHLKGILCRCTGYASIVRALLFASAMQGRAGVTPGGSA